MVMDNYLNKAHKPKKAPHWCVDHQKWETEPHDESKSLEKWVMVKGDNPEPPDVKVNLGERVGGLGDRVQFKDPSKKLNDAVTAARAKKARENPGVVDRIKRLFNKDVGEELSSRVQNLGGPVKPQAQPKRDERKTLIGELETHTPGIKTTRPLEGKTMDKPRPGETAEEWWARHEK